MKIYFPEKDPDKVVESLQEAMGRRELSRIVNFSRDGDSLVVTISKLGTSTLTFQGKISSEGVVYDLCSEKIAMSHRVFKKDVTKKIEKLIDKVGGRVE